MIKNSIILVMLVFLTGCAGLRVSSYTIEGDDVKSTWGKGDAQIYVQAITAWAFMRPWPKMPKDVIIVFNRDIKEDQDGGKPTSTEENE